MQDPPQCITKGAVHADRREVQLQHPQLSCWLLSRESVRSCPRAKPLFQGIWHSILETAWILEVVGKYLQSPTQLIPKPGASDLGFKALPQVSPPQHVIGSMCPSISCCLPNASRFILSLALPHSFIEAQGLTSGSGWMTKGFINPICLGSLHQ